MVLSEALHAAEGLRTRLRASPPQYFQEVCSWSFVSMGTTNQIIFEHRNAGVSETVIAYLTEWLAGFEVRYSRFIPTSLISKINDQAGGDPVSLEPRDEELFALCDWFYWKTKGIFDPTSGALLAYWDYHSDAPRFPSARQLAEARQAVGWSKIERSPESIRLPHPGMRLDLGGIGKEYAVDQTAGILESAGIHSYMISFGRDIRCAGHAPGEDTWRIGLEHPQLPDQCWAGVGLNKGAIAASGQARRFVEIDGKTFGHLLDVRSCEPAQNDTQASWVIAPTCTEAGILASTAIILGYPEGIDLINTATHCAGCLWSGTHIHQTRSFNRYVLDDHTR